MQQLFVYGTLLKRSGGALAHLLATHAEYITDGYFHGRLYDLGNYPGAVTDDDINNKVYGSLYRLPESPGLVKVLDHYEGIGEDFEQPYEYLRESVQIFLDANETTEAWVYLYNWSVEETDRIVSGVYEGN